MSETQSIKWNGDRLDQVMKTQGISLVSLMIKGYNAGIRGRFSDGAIRKHIKGSSPRAEIFFFYCSYFREKPEWFLSGADEKEHTIVRPKTQKPKRRSKKRLPRHRRN